MAVLGRISGALGLVDAKREVTLSDGMVGRLAVRASSDRQRISTLSGGNQQKVILGRWLATKPRILLLDEPTRGIDVGAKAEIHALIRSLSAEGVAVLVASSEMPEILTLSDRVLVLSAGRLMADIPVAEADEQVILRFALPQKLST
jgi:ABC-type sugar transport system ATPase subunit